MLELDCLTHVILLHVTMLLYFAFASLNVFVAAMQTNKKCAIKLRGFLLLDR